MRASNVIAAVLFFAVFGYLGSVLIYGKYGIRQDGTFTKIFSPNDAEDCYKWQMEIKSEYATNAQKSAPENLATTPQQEAALKALQQQQEATSPGNEALRDALRKGQEASLLKPDDADEGTRVLEEAARKCSQNPDLCNSKPDDADKSKSASDHADVPVPEATPFTEYVARCMASPDQCKSDAERAASRERQGRDQWPPKGVEPVKPKFKPQVKVAETRDGCAYEPLKSVEYDWLYPVNAFLARLALKQWEAQCNVNPYEPGCPRR